MFTVIFLIALLATQSQPVTGTIGDTGLIIYSQQQSASSATSTTDSIANNVLVMFLLALATIFLISMALITLTRRSRGRYALPKIMALGPGI